MPVYSPNTKTDEQKIAHGTHVTVAASDTIATGLKNVDRVIASFETDPADAAMIVSAVPANQSTAPGSITIKTWRNTGGTDPTPIVADAFSKRIVWVAFGR